MRHFPVAQRGVVLVSALLLLLVMTILAMTMFRSNGIQELIAGNVREKQRAIQSAEGAEQYAEMWLSSGGNSLANSVDCTKAGLMTYSATSVPDICEFSVATIDDAKNVTTVPWTISSNEVGFMFFPGATSGTGDLSVSTSGGANTYYQVPRFYITLLTPTPIQNKAFYQIDAWNWGGTKNTAAVVESVYVVTCNTCAAGL
jgi:type IV pilus assembly protein PilX